MGFFEKITHLFEGKKVEEDVEPPRRPAHAGPAIDAPAPELAHQPAAKNHASSGKKGASSESQRWAPKQDESSSGGLEKDARDALDDSILEIKRSHESYKKRYELPKLPGEEDEKPAANKQDKPSESPIDAARKRSASVKEADAQPSASQAHATKRAMKKLLAQDDSASQAHSVPKLPDSAPVPEQAPPEPEEPASQQQDSVVYEPAEHTFHLRSGKQIDTLQELARACKRMPPEEWDHHVTQERNDFADWIKHNFSDEIAYDAAQCENPFELYVVLAKHKATKGEPALEDSLTQLKRELEQVRADIAQDLEEKLSTVEDHEKRLKQLREDISREQKSFREQERALEQEVERLQQEQAMFEETIKRVEQQNKQLFAEHEQAKQTHEEVSRLRLQLRDEHEELKHAKQVVQDHLERDFSHHVEGGDLLDLVEQVRSDIEAERWEAARSGYRRLSKAFEKAELDDEHRREIYNLIRGLYADIHLHAISE